MEVLKDLEGLVCSTQAMAGLLKISVQHLGMLEKQKVVKKLAPGRWPLTETVSRYVQHLQRERRVDTSGALRDVRVEQLRALKMKNDLREHAVIAVSESQLALDTVCAYVCMELDSLPARSTRDLAAQKKLQEEIDALRHRVADKLAATCKALREGKDPDVIFKGGPDGRPAH